MVIVGKQGCRQCKKLKASLSSIKYIEIPDVHIGLGDTICAITCFLRIVPCRSCKIRQHWCNKIFPYWWNKHKISSEHQQLKQKLLLLNVRQYPVIMDDALSNIIAIDELEYINKEIARIYAGIIH